MRARSSGWLNVARTLAGVSLAAAACNPSDFEKVTDKAPVRSVGVPDGFRGTSVGRVVTPLAPGASAGRFVMAASDGPSAAVVELNVEGKAKVRPLTNDVLGSLGGNSILSLAAVPTATDQARVLLGVPDAANSEGRMFVLSVGAEFAASKGFQSRAMPQPDRFGLAVASAKVVPGGSEPDYVALSNEQLIIFEGGNPEKAKNASLRDIDTSSLCNAGFNLKGRLGTRRSLVVADFVPGGVPEIAVGQPGNFIDEEGTQRAVASVRVFRVPEGATGECPLDMPFIIAPPSLSETYGGVSNFGFSLAAGDIDGDGNADIVVGAPPDRVFVYFGPFTDGTAPEGPLVIKPPGDQVFMFGWSIALAELDGTPGLELLVGDPDATVDGKLAAGQVAVYAGVTRTAAGMPTLLHDFKPEAHAEYGYSVFGLPFKPAGNHELVGVGAIKEVFVHFSVAGLYTDSRIYPDSSTP